MLAEAEPGAKLQSVFLLRGSGSWDLFGFWTSRGQAQKQRRGGKKKSCIFLVKRRSCWWEDTDAKIKVCVTLELGSLFGSSLGRVVCSLFSTPPSLLPASRAVIQIFTYKRGSKCHGVICISKCIVERADIVLPFGINLFMSKEDAQEKHFFDW